MQDNIKVHPCFSENSAKNFARIHLPLIKNCNLSCNYCNKDYSCINESRPGVTQKLITFKDIPEILEKSLIKYPNLKIIGFAGPGEVLTEPETIYNAIKFIKENYPQLQICLSTNGYAVLDNIELFEELKIPFITITLNTINSETAGKIYKSADITRLIEKQIESIKVLKGLDTVIKINSIAIPDINLPDIIEVAKLVGEIGVYAQNIMPFYPVKGSTFQDLRAPSMIEIQSLKDKCSKYIKQLSHCRRCRADAAGCLDSLDNIFD